MNAVDAIRLALAKAPLTLLSGITEGITFDLRNAASTLNVRARQGMVARANAGERALDALAGGDFEALAEDMGAGIVALGVAAKVLDLSAAERTARAVEQWGN